jgi:hypothetical protein
MPGPLHRPSPPSPSANDSQVRRSSSVYSRATKCWEAPANWFDDPPPLPPVPSRAVLETRRLSYSNPQLSNDETVSPLTPELDQPLPPMLGPRTNQPLLPSPSPSLAPHSIRKQSSVATLPALLPREDEDRVWRRLPPDEVQLSPSPPPMSPITTHNYSQSSIDVSSSPLTPYVPMHLRSYSDESPPAATLSRPFDSPSLGGSATNDHWRNNSIDKAFFHMRLGSDISTRSDNRSVDRSISPKGADNQSLGSEDVLSSDYRNKLLGKYKDLVAPPTGHFEDVILNSDAEETGHELKMVPAPLFWENRKKELYPLRAIYAQQRKTGDGPRSSLVASNQPAKKHKKRISLSSAPLQMILPSQYKRKSAEGAQEPSDSPTTATWRRALSLRLRSRKPQDGKDFPEGSPRTVRDKAISKPMQDGPMPLQLPAMAYKDTVTMKPASPRAIVEQAKPQYPWRSSSNFDLNKGMPTVPRVVNIPRPVSPQDQHGEVYGRSSPDEKGYQHPGPGFNIPRSMDRRPRAGPRAAPIQPLVISTRRITGAFHKARSSLGNRSEFEKGHTRNTSSGGHSSANEQLVSAFSPIEDKRSVMRPAIFDIAREAMRERDRTKRRKELKSQIKFVGRVDPKQVNQSQEKQRRETFGEGWI